MQGMITIFCLLFLIVITNLQVTYGAPTYRLSLLRRTFSLIKLHVIGLIKTKFKLFSALNQYILIFESISSTTAARPYLMPLPLTLSQFHTITLLFAGGFMVQIFNTLTS